MWIYKSHFIVDAFDFLNMTKKSRQRHSTVANTLMHACTPMIIFWKDKIKTILRALSQSSSGSRYRKSRMVSLEIVFCRKWKSIHDISNKTDQSVQSSILSILIYPDLYVVLVLFFLHLSRYQLHLLCPSIHSFLLSTRILLLLSLYLPSF